MPDYLTSIWATRLYLPAVRAWGYPEMTLRVPGRRFTSSRSLYDRPVALLVGPETFSAAEDMALAFQTADRGPVLGEPSGGSTGQPLFVPPARRRHRARGRRHPAERSDPADGGGRPGRPRPGAGARRGAGGRRRRLSTP